MNTELLNTIKEMLVNFANEKGISLASEFGTPENFKQFVISFTIKAIVDVCELSIEEAYDVVMGSGAFQQLAESCWEQLTAANA